MLSVEQLEQLSKYRDGELSQLERIAVERELLSTEAGRAGLEQLEELDALSLELVPPSATDVAAAQRATPAVPRRWTPWVLGAAAALLAFGVAWTRLPEASPVVQVRPASGDRALENGWVLLEGSALSETAEGWLLENGTALVRGPTRINGVEIPTVAVVSMEPSPGRQHVTRVAALTRSEEERDAMKTGTWIKLGTLSVLWLAQPVEAAKPQQPLASMPQVKPDAPKPAVSIDALNDAVITRSKPISECYAQGLKQNPKLAGTLPMRLRLKRDGAFTRLEFLDMAANYTVENPLVASCVMKEFFKMSLPPISEDRLELMYELKFEQRGEPVGIQVVLPKGDEVLHVMMHNRTELVRVEAGTSPTLGPADAPVTVVLFSSHTCEFCKQSLKTVRALQQIYGQRVRFVYKHRILASDPEAKPAAIAAQAAAEQGRFWEFADRLYSNAEKDPEQIASELRLDINRWRLTRDGAAAAAQVDADVAQADKLGVKGIPSWFINGREVVGARPIDVLRKEIDAALAAKP